MRIISPGYANTNVAALYAAASGGLLDGSESDGTNLFSGGATDFTGWATINATLSANSQTASDGTTTAARFLEDASSGRHGIYKDWGITANTARTFSVYAKQNTRRYLQIYIVGAGAAGAVAAYFDLQTGAATDSLVSTSGTGTAIGTPTIAAAVNGYYKCTFPGIVINATDTTAYFQLMGSDAGTNGTVSGFDSGSPTYAGSTSAGIDLWRPKLT